MYSIPSRLLRNDRPVDPCFEQEEFLYRRFKNDHLCNRQLISTAFKFNNGCSVSRGKYSQPEDVLLPDYNNNIWGIASFQVGHVLHCITCNDSSGQFQFEVRHTPRDLDYPHSDIFAYLRESQEPYTPSSNFISKKFRMSIVRHVNIIQLPGQTHPTLN